MECWLPAQHSSSEQLQGEWYAGFSTLQPLLQGQLQYTDNILCMCGPQASHLHEDLYDSGYRGITTIHTDSRVVQEMRQKQVASNRLTLHCQVADLAEGLAFEHSPYTAIIDKGALDAVLCRDTGLQQAEAAMQHVWNNLKGPGSFVWLSHGPPSLRVPLLRRHQWSSVSVKVIKPAEQPHKAADGLIIADAVINEDYGVAVTYVYMCKKPYV